MASVQVNRQRLEETMYVVFSQLLYFWGLEEQRGRGFMLMQREGEKPQKEELLWGAIKVVQWELNAELLYLELPTYLSLLGCKNVYGLYKIPSY